MDFTKLVYNNNFITMRANRLDTMYRYAIANELCKNKGNFAELIGITNSTLSKAFSGEEKYLSDAFLIRVNNALNNVFSLDWVLNGTLPMMKEQPSSAEQQTTPSAERKAAEGGIPLIPIEAMAGYNGYDMQGVRLEDCARYTIPEFAELRADFMIRVSGSSMYPKYSSGDLLACRKIQDITFFQWGKVYVLDSNQGAMVKRLFPSDENPDKIVCKSDNPNYPPFELSRTDIRSVSLVLGAIRFE